VRRRRRPDRRHAPRHAAGHAAGRHAAGRDGPRHAPRAAARVPRGVDRDGGEHRLAVAQRAAAAQQQAELAGCSTGRRRRASTRWSSTCAPPATRSTGRPSSRGAHAHRHAGRRSGMGPARVRGPRGAPARAGAARLVQSLPRRQHRRLAAAVADARVQHQARPRARARRVALAGSG
jgi:hypothetical protein